MSGKLRLLLSESYDPWFNLAVEECIFKQMPADQRVLFLWRNDNTVVIGRAQNPWKECNTRKMEEDGVKLARRSSGGGAVFHDLGNTCFTFMAGKPEYNKTISTQIILDGLSKAGIQATASGRNDLVVPLADGERKISGSAYKETKDRGFHHGTLLINADSGSINEKINYSINTSKDRDNWSNSAYFGIDHSIINTGYAISQNGHQTTSSINASGSLLATPDTGLLFSNVRRDTVAIAKIKNIEGITFNDSPPTDKEGNTIVGVSPYIENNLKINTEEIPNNVELLDSVQNFTPADKAIIYREFKYSTIQRYILRIKNKNGDFISAGSAVRNKNDEYIGFVSNSGVLLLNLLDKPNKLFVISPNGEKCTLNLEKVESNDHKIMEIECNE